MFKREANSLPSDATFDLGSVAFGHRVTETGEFISVRKGRAAAAMASDDAGTDREDISSTHSDYHFDRFVSDNDRVNEVWQDSIHAEARRVMFDQLAILGFKQFFLSGSCGEEVSSERPDEAHTSFLATADLDALKNKRNVLVIVGEHSNDLGVWAYRHLMGAGGFQHGSAVGIAGKIVASGSASSCTPPHSGHPGTDALNNTFAKVNMTSAFAKRNDAVVLSKADDPPGLIILNPGQLIYSHDLKKNMSLTSWLARRRRHALSFAHTIDAVYNRVPGHFDTSEHVKTMFEHVIPSLTAHSAELYVVGISDGSEELVKYMDEKISADDRILDDLSIAAFAAIEPTYQPNDINSDIVRNFLHERGRAWVCSALPKGTFLSAPGVHRPIEHWSFDEDTQNQPEMQQTESSSSKLSAAISTVSLNQDCGTDVKTGLGDSFVNLEPNIGPSSITNFDEVTEETKFSNTLGSGIKKGPLRVVNAADRPATPSTPTEMHEWLRDSDVKYESAPVSSATYSSGEPKVVELIWPGVMDSVLDFFRCVAEENEGKESTWRDIPQGSDASSTDSGAEEAEEAKTVSSLLGGTSNMVCADTSKLEMQMVQAREVTLSKNGPTATEYRNDAADER